MVSRTVSNEFDHGVTARNMNKASKLIATTSKWLTESSTGPITRLLTMASTPLHVNIVEISLVVVDVSSCRSSNEGPIIPRTKV